MPDSLKFVARPKGFEPLTFAFGGQQKQFSAAYPTWLEFTKPMNY